MSFASRVIPLLGKTRATVAFGSRSVDTSDASTYTFTGVTTGGTAGLLVVWVHSQHASSNHAIASVTCGGNAMTRVLRVAASDSGVTSHLSAYTITHPGTATATIVVSLDNGAGTPVVVSRAQVTLETVINYTSSTPATASSTTITTGAMTTSATATGAGCAVAEAQIISGTITGMSWTGLTEVHDGRVELSLAWSGAADAVAAGSVSVTATASDGATYTAGRLGLLVFV